MIFVVSAAAIETLNIRKKLKKNRASERAMEGAEFKERKERKKSQLKRTEGIEN